MSTTLAPKLGLASDPTTTITADSAPRIQPTLSSKRILIIGGGVSGLMSAWHLLDAGYHVTILAAAWSNPHHRITSQVAGALWEYPPGGCGLSELMPPPPAGGPKPHSDISDYRRWALQGLYVYAAMAAHPHFSDSVSVRPLTNFYLTPSSTGTEKFSELAAKNVPVTTVDFRVPAAIPATKLDINTSYSTGLSKSYTHPVPIIDPDIALPALLALCISKGLRTVTRKLPASTPLRRQASALCAEFGADLILNATGLAARELAQDPSVFGVRGAVVHVSNTGSLSEALLLPAQDGEKTVFVVPRNERRVLLGSIVDVGEEDVDGIEQERISAVRARCEEFLPSLGKESLCEVVRGVRPFTGRNCRVAWDDDDGDEDGMGVAERRLLHNYGHGGSGWTLAVGCAARVRELVDRRFVAQKAEDRHVKARIMQSRL